MLNIYPSNRLEDLSTLLDAVLHTPKKHVLQSDTVLVQNSGMQHWLNLRLAEQRGISMNLDFRLPASFFWQIIRDVLGRQAVPELSPYSREVMSWRLYALLKDARVTDNPLCEEATRFWRQNNRNADSLRFQLARELADLYEQYLIYRPDWIRAWDRGETPHWQALLWQLLVAAIPDHPLKLLTRAIRRLPGSAGRLPQRLCVFGINALAPLWLNFLGEVARYTQVHVFHLNPCVEYWGDIRSEKQLQRWLDSDEECQEINPLLANLGAQGREFLALLQEQPTAEFTAFDAPLISGENHSVLQHLQMDIFALEDARLHPKRVLDQSLTFVSAHSALREVQGLHDWLLHQFNADPALTPADVLVTCPRIEDYAPAVQAVFGNSWQVFDPEAPGLPCSIADRALQDEQPLVAAFSELLELPDSRFQVSAILGLLRLPPVQRQFRFSETDLRRMETWLAHAAIHWGLDAGHRAQVLDTEVTKHSFTWEQGLQRLLLGFSWGHEKTLYAGQLLLPDVEGEDALLLGKLLLVIDGLKTYAQRLAKQRTAREWQVLLKEMNVWLFDIGTDDERAQHTITQLIDSLGDCSLAAGFDEAVPLVVIRDWLRAGFLLPEPGRRFLVGQVSFCSMIPMRSVPFRVIAVLGLNDGQFPRQRPPRGFDLMAQEIPRPGDRSLRGDDRYLFLETLISAREKLYFSYQGRDIKTNQTREPSLVLRELMDYLQQGYGWSWSGEDSCLYQLPLQPFSVQNYRGQEEGTGWQSFDKGWLELLRKQPSGDSRQLTMPMEARDVEMPLEKILGFFAHPVRAFAREQLGLYLDDDGSSQVSDSEPFAASHLDRYLLQERLVQAYVGGEEDESLLQQARLSGQLPDTPLLEPMLEEWRQQSQDFSRQVIEQGGGSIKMQQALVTLDNTSLSASLPYAGDELLFYRLARGKGKDEMRLWLHHLLAHCDRGRSLVTRGIFRHEKKEGKFRQLLLQPVDDAEALLLKLLHVWKQGMESPMLCGADLGKQWIATLADEPHRFAGYWADDFNRRGPAYDPYYALFWPETPDIQSLPADLLQEIYAPLYAHLSEAEL
jgi:exodeoxyribonuclease V gamma subunit